MPREQAPPGSIYVFLSHSNAPKDRPYLDQLEKHLSILKYRGLITTWYARKVTAGQDYIQQIDIHLNTAHIILLLISADFLGSKYCYYGETARAMERYERGEAQVVPVLVRYVNYDGASFAKLRPLPTNGKPVKSWRDHDQAFRDIAREIERLVHELRAPEVARSGALPPVPPPIESVEPFSSDYATSQQAPYQAASGRLVTRLLIACLAVVLLGAGILLALRPGFLPLLGKIVLFIGAGVLFLLVLLSVVIAIVWVVRRVRRAREARRQEEAHRRREEAQRQEEARRQEEAQRREEARRQEEAREYYKQALWAFEQALHQNSTDAVAYSGKGNALVGLGRYWEALAAFQQAGTLMPQAATYVSMGSVLATLGRYDGALSVYEQALKLDDSYGPAYMEASKALRHLGRMQEALQAYERARQLGYDDE